MCCSYAPGILNERRKYLYGIILPPRTYLDKKKKPYGQTCMRFDRGKALEPTPAQPVFISPRGGRYDGEDYLANTPGVPETPVPEMGRMAMRSILAATLAGMMT